ncbi:MAG: Glu-tRNA(Gln) amidotransferase subunit GatE [Desulfurococcaceae archaeon]|jgi:glutamyl-tRNA(Gln) amidotransferase subunit E|nr:Glu-tRNA(Gln) amidotransferase subunit GatE [Desulfurococcaceae archaeon]
MSIDYSSIGLRVGIEIHQQLATKEKLFCSCPAELASDETPKREVRRFLKVAKSEVGEVDPAAQYEIMKGRNIIYEVPENHACLVELDEEPPHDLNREAVLITLAIAKALNSTPVDEIEVMRKIVVDGSNTTGFQRTAIVAVGGYLVDDDGLIRIQTICLEEDAARKVDEGRGYVKYNLDRLGIPLIEIATGPDIRSPEQAMRVAFKLGLLLRLSGKVKRGIGTIRQDLNISIKGGVKTEVKGVGRLELIPKVVEYEVSRQLRLLEIRDELIKRGVKESDLPYLMVDATDVFLSSKSRLVSSSLSKGLRIYAAPLKGFGGLLKIELMPGRRFGTELSDYAKAWGGVGGIIHSDELPSYGISEEEREAVFRLLSLDRERDAYVLVISDAESAERALKAVMDRARHALIGIPKETRAANPDGTTRYMRPQPGAMRMYPETDIRPIPVTQELLEEAERLKPPTPEDLLTRLVREHKLAKTLAEQLIRDPLIHTYLNLVEELGDKVQPHVIATTLMIHLKGLKSEGLDVSLIDEQTLKTVLEKVGENILSKDAVPEILREYSLKKGEVSLEELIKKYTGIGVGELEKLIDEVIETLRETLLTKKEKAFNIVMGEVMKKVRGRIDGKVVAETVRKKLKEALGT